MPRVFHGVVAHQGPVVGSKGKAQVEGAGAGAES